MRLPPVLLEDAALLVFDKPSGLLVAPDRWDKTRPNLMAAVHAARGLETNNVHRLDADTSGVLLCAKTAEALRSLTAQFEAHTVEKRYLALVAGHPAAERFTIDQPLGDNPRKAGRMRVDLAHGKPAVTEVTVLERFRGHALVECRPQTGRTHQLRVHLASVGYPIVADPFYGGAAAIFLSAFKPGYRHKRDEPERPLLGRLALHAFSLAFDHPLSGARTVVEAPQPKEFSVALKYLREFAPLSRGALR